MLLIELYRIEIHTQTQRDNESHHLLIELYRIEIRSTLRKQNFEQRLLIELYRIEIFTEAESTDAETAFNRTL